MEKVTKNVKTLLVVDGQGGGIGKAIIERIVKAEIDAEILAIGTNSTASAVMRKAGAHQTATGENAIIYNATYADCILGPIGIISANSLLGEISPNIAAAVAQSPCPKLLIPLNRCNLYIAGASESTLTEKLDEIITLLKEILN
jgi:hypothetical protein